MTALLTPLNAVVAVTGIYFFFFLCVFFWRVCRQSSRWNRGMRRAIDRRRSM